MHVCSSNQEGLEHLLTTIIFYDDSRHCSRLQAKTDNYVSSSEATTKDNWNGGVDLSGGGEGYDNGSIVLK
jgi:hypothetical protein